MPAENITHPSRHLYLLALGLLTGIVLGPYCLGQFSPDTYHHWFLADLTERQALHEHDQHAAAQRARLAATGVTDHAVAQYNLENQDARQSLLDNLKQVQQQQQSQWHQRMTALILAMLFVMAVESLFGYESLNIRARLTTIRYAFMAIWLTLLLAVPDAISHVSVIFVALLIAVSLAAGFIPLHKQNAG